MYRIGQSQIQRLRRLLSSSREDVALFKSLAPVYDFIYTVDYDYSQQFNSVRAASPTTASRVLEIGCGGGHLLQYLESTFEFVIGIDESRDMIEITSERVNEAHVAVGDATAIPFDVSFDVMVMFGPVISQITADRRLSSVFEQCVEQLSPSGAIIFNYHNATKLEDGRESTHQYVHSPFTVTQVESTNVIDGDENIYEYRVQFEIDDAETGCTRVVEDQLQLRMYEPQSIEKRLRNCGFEAIEHDGDNLITTTAYRSAPKRSV